MSLNHVIQDVDKPWFNAGFKSMTVQGRFLYSEPFRAEGDTLKLTKSLDETALIATWQAVLPQEDIVYNNQVDISFRNKVYNIGTGTSVMSFDSFKYAAPHYYNLTVDDNNLLISSTGYYYACYSFLTFDTNKSSTFSMYLNNDIIPSSIISFVPSRVAPTVGTEQPNVCTGSCIFRCDVGINNLQFKISPASSIQINGQASVLTIIKLSNF